jgi:hypothetical protein
MSSDKKEDKRKTKVVLFSCTHETYSDIWSIEGILNVIKRGNQSDGKEKRNLVPILIGSRAMKEVVPKFARDISKSDWDYIMDINNVEGFIAKIRKEIAVIKMHEILVSNKLMYKFAIVLKDGMRYEIEVPMGKIHSADFIMEFLQEGKDRIMTPHIGETIVPSAEILEVIKSSHIYWPKYFTKHITDLHVLRRFLMKDADYIVANRKSIVPDRSSFMKGILIGRLRETEQKYGIPGKDINLNMTNEKFLDKDNLFVDRIIPHDDIHERVKLGSVPKYKLMKKEGEEGKATCRRELFDKLTLAEQLDSVREEAMTLALERYLLSDLIKDHQEAYLAALERVCTTITKGWFRDFAIDNYPELMTCPLNLKAIRDDIMKGYHERVKKKQHEELMSGISDRIKNMFDEKELNAVAPILGSIEAIDKSEIKENNSEADDDRESNYGDEPDEEEHTKRYYMTINGNKYLLEYENKMVREQEDCSSSISWTIKFSMVKYTNGCEKNESHDLFGWDKTFKFEWQVKCRVSEGESSFNSKDTDIDLENKLNLGIEESLFIRILLAKFNPQFIGKGNKVYADCRDQNYIKINELLAKENLKPQHPLFDCYLLCRGKKSCTMDGGDTSFGDDRGNDSDDDYGYYGRRSGYY